MGNQADAGPESTAPDDLMIVTPTRSPAQVRRGERLVREGYAPVPGGRVWYRAVVPRRERGQPLLALHGGPGVPHDYFEPLEALADERLVVFYDQLGCGRSDRPTTDATLWTLERFVDELADLRTWLGLDDVHLLGQSWGTMLAAEYVLRQPLGIRSLVLASPILSAARFSEDTRRLRAALPEDESIGRAAFYQRHGSGTADPLPPLDRAAAGANMDIYLLMWGPSEYEFVGSLSTFERVDRLGEIQVPVLMTCGRFDECTPEATEWYASHIPGARVCVVENAAHMALLTSTSEYLGVLRSFLDEHDRGPGTDTRRTED